MDNKFRSLEDVRRLLKQMGEDIGLETQMADKNIRQLARLSAASALKAAEEFDFSGTTGGKRTKKTINVDFPIVKVPNAAALEKNYKVTEKLSEQYKRLLDIENDLKMTFGKNPSPSYKETLGSVTKMRSNIEATLKRLFEELASVAQRHAPKEYLKFVASLAEELNSKQHLEVDGVDTMTYAALDKTGNLIFAGYIILKNAVNDQGNVAPHIYITIKWTVGGDVEVFVENEFVAPTLLGEGTVVENTKQAAKVIEQQLSLEGFSAQIGNLPVAMQLREPVGGLRSQAFSAAEHIKDVKADRDELIFVLDPQLSEEEIDEVKNQLYLEVKSLRKKKRSTQVRMRTAGNKLIFTFSNLDQEGGVHPSDLEFLEDKYKLSPTQLRKLANVINGA